MATNYPRRCNIVTDHLIKVFGDPGTGKARVGPGSWAAFKFLQYGQMPPKRKSVNERLGRILFPRFNDVPNGPLALA